MHSENNDDQKSMFEMQRGLPFENLSALAPQKKGSDIFGLDGMSPLKREEDELRMQYLMLSESDLDDSGHEDESQRAAAAKVPEVSASSVPSRELLSQEQLAISRLFKAQSPSPVLGNTVDAGFKERQMSFGITVEGLLRDEGILREKKDALCQTTLSFFQRQATAVQTEEEAQSENQYNSVSMNDIAAFMDN